MCVQETRWKASKAVLLWCGYEEKLRHNPEGGVHKKQRRGEKSVRQGHECEAGIVGMMMNILGGYAPQVSCEMEKKDEFWT